MELLEGQRGCGRGEGDPGSAIVLRGDAGDVVGCNGPLKTKECEYDNTVLKDHNISELLNCKNNMQEPEMCIIYVFAGTEPDSITAIHDLGTCT